MLQSLRKPALKSVFLGGFLFFMGLFLASIPLQLSAQQDDSKADDKVLASVDETLITRRDLRFWLFETRLQHPETRTIANKVLLDEMLQQAVEEEVLYQGLWDPTKEIRDEDLEPIFEDNFKDFVEKARGLTLFNLRLEEAGIAESDFRPWLRERIQRAMTIENAITDRTLQEDDSILEALPNAKPNRYLLREIYIQAGNPTGARSLTPPTQEDWLLAEKEIREVIVHLADNMTFDEAAKVFSEDPKTAPDGGMLGWFAAESLNEELLAELLKTPKGGITNPLKLKSGYSIYQIESVTTEAQEKLEEVRERIRRKLIQDLIQAADIQLAPGYTLTYDKSEFE